jgi:thermitase
VRGRIENNTDAIAGTGTYWSKGRINAYKAVSAP